MFVSFNRNNAHLFLLIWLGVSTHKLMTRGWQTSPTVWSLILECTVAWVCGQDQLTLAITSISTFGTCNNWFLIRYRFSLHFPLNGPIIFCLAKIINGSPWFCPGEESLLGFFFYQIYFCSCVLCIHFLIIAAIPAPRVIGLASIQSQQLGPQFYFSSLSSLNHVTFLLHPSFLLFSFLYLSFIPVLTGQ